MQEFRTPAQEAAEDIFFGQVVAIWARWAVILAAAILVLWNATSIAELTVNMILIVILMAMNFFLHGRYLMQLPANRTLVLLMSLLDVAIISAMVWTFAGSPGLESPYFVFYYVVIAAFAFVFPPRWTAFFTVLALVAYLGTCLVADASAFNSAVAAKSMVMRLITLAAMGGLGTYYWRIQRDRRRSASGYTGAPPEDQAVLKVATTGQ